MTELAEEFSDSIKNALAVLPDKPGVYLMHDAEGKVIYVGKAVVLKNRVRSYFRNLASHTPKVKAMVAKIAEIETIVTSSEVEALILECNLIKKYRPRYNISLKDDKTYPYLKVTLQEDFPRLYMTRRLLRWVQVLRSLCRCRCHARHGEAAAQHVPPAHLSQNESGSALLELPYQALPGALCRLCEQGRIWADD